MTGTVEDAQVPRTVPLDPGEIVGDGLDQRWRVVRHVADGGFSSVYEVRAATTETVDRHGAAPRALKCLWGTPAELTAVHGEAAKTAAVDGHAGVLRLVTSFRFERPVPPHHHVGLVLELADEDLPTFGTRVQPDERAWAAVFEQVAAGLEHIHERRVVHGDIKPTNVLRLGARFAVADFGVSAPLESTRSAGIGLARTIAFWPPESASQGVLLADGVRRPPVEGWRASQAGDVWALAVSAHRMLTGRHITAGTTPEQQYELVCLGRYAVDGRIGPGWRRLLEECLVHDPAQRRVGTAAELRRRLAELALPDGYAGVPWPPGVPRLAALLDLDPAAGGPLLALTLDRPAGRVSGALVSADGVLPAAVRHLTRDVVPALAARVTPPAGQAGRARSAAPAGTPGPADPAATQVVSAEELERTRAQTASVSAQRDRIAADRDRLARSRDDVAADRDRLRRDHDALARRLERLEREAAERRRADPTRVLAGRPAAVPERHDPTRALAPAEAAGAAVGDPAHRNWREPASDPAAALRSSRGTHGGGPAGADGRGRPARYAGGGDADRYRDAGRGATARYREPGRGTVAVSDGEPARPAPSTADGRGLFRRSRPAVQAPPPAPARAFHGPVARLGRMLRRLIGLVLLLAAFAVLAVVGVAALTGRTPVEVLDAVISLYQQVRSIGGG
ncbi:MAG TPA: protein kinase [Mycobacteriales bacterium]